MVSQFITAKVFFNLVEMNGHYLAAVRHSDCIISCLLAEYIFHIFKLNAFQDHSLWNCLLNVYFFEFTQIMGGVS